MLSLVLLLATTNPLPPPQQATAAKTRTEAAPTETAPLVREYLQAAEDRLYHVDEEGLESWSFEAPYEVPSGPGQRLRVALATVDWTAAGGTTVTVAMSNELGNLAAYADTLRAQIQSQSEQLPGYALNRYFERLLEKGFVATLEGADTGRVKVSFTPEPGSAAEASPPFTSLEWTFDEDDLPLRSVTTMVAEGPMGPSTLTFSVTHVWRKVSSGGDALILDRLESVQEGAGMRMNVVTTFDYVTVDGLTILSGFVEKPEHLPVANEVKFGNMKVNGKAVRS